MQNRYLDLLVDPRLQGVYRLFVLSFKDDNGPESHKQYYLPAVEIKDYNDMIDEKNLLDHPIEKDLKLNENIRKIATAQGDDSTTGCLLDYSYFKEYHKLIAIDQSKRQKLDADPKAVQQINFTGNLDRAEGAKMCFVIEEARERVLDFSKGAGKAL